MLYVASHFTGVCKKVLVLCVRIYICDSAYAFLCV